MEGKMNLKEMKEKLSEVDEGTLKRYEIGVSSEDGLTLLTSEEDGKGGFSSKKEDNNQR